MGCDPGDVFQIYPRYPQEAFLQSGGHCRCDYRVYHGRNGELVGWYAEHVARCSGWWMAGCAQAAPGRDGGAVLRVRDGEYRPAYAGAGQGSCLGTYSIAVPVTARISGDHYADGAVDCSPDKNVAQVLWSAHRHSGCSPVSRWPDLLHAGTCPGGWQSLLLPGELEAEGGAQAAEEGQARAGHHGFRLPVLPAPGVCSRTIHGVYPGACTSR